MMRHSNKITYRKDLDGLRAIAVIAVIVFHMNNSWLSGGFVGVDVFFTLSGFFICRHIYEAIQKNNFYLTDFYKSRIRRLVPNLLFVLLVTTVFATLYLIPSDLKRYGVSLISSILAFSNIAYLFGGNGYFFPDAAAVPLLHTWSLSLEWQFYVICPVILIGLHKYFPRNLTTILIGLVGISFLLGCYITMHHPSASFYLFPTRAWEIGLGGLVALGVFGIPQARWQREASAFSGLLLILISCILYSPRTPLPGVAAMLPCGGTALLIWAGSGVPEHDASRSSVVARLLSVKPCVFLGIISYSLYLWHWPVLSLSNYVIPEEPDLYENARIFALIFILSCISWNYVEKPFRYNGYARMPWTRDVKYVVSTALAVVVCGCYLVWTDGLTSRFSTKAVSLASATDNVSPERERCHADGNGNLDYSDTCLFGNSIDPQIVVFADSHGVEIAYALSEWGVEHGFSVRQVTASSCPPVMNFVFEDLTGCPLHVEKMVAGLVKDRPSIVVLSSYMFFWHKEWNEGGGFWRGFEDTLETISNAGHHIVLLGGTPPHDRASLPRLLAMLESFDKAKSYRFPIDIDAAREIDMRLNALSEKYDASYIPLLSYLCGDQGSCSGLHKGTPIYSDRHHLSLDTTVDLVEQVIGPGIASLPSYP